MGTGDLCRVPPAALRQGSARQSSGMDRAGIVEGSCGYQAHGFSIRGKFVLSRNTGYKTTRVANRHVAKRSSDPRVAYHEVKVQVRDLVRVVGIIASCAQRGVSIRGKLVLSSPRC